MRQLLPDQRSHDVDELYAGLTLPVGDHGPWLALGMVATLDGASAIDGKTGTLGGQADHVAFRRLRAAADVILVGAGTVRAEEYGPVGGVEARRVDRIARGLSERPRLAIVTDSLRLEPDHRVFSQSGERPLVLTHEAAPRDRAAALADVAEIMRVGTSAVDLRGAMDLLASRGLRRVLCEGGPTLNGALLAADLVDEVFLTIAPVAVSGPEHRIIGSAAQLPPRTFEVWSLHEHDGELLVRYRRKRSTTAAEG